MPEEKAPLTRRLEWLLTLSFASLVTSAAILGGALSLWLQEYLSKSQILGMALGLAGVLLASVWTAAITIGRLRARISKLENPPKRQRPSVDVTDNEFDVISLLSQDDPGPTVEEIGQFFGVIDSVARHFCEELDRKGLVSTTRFCGENRRIHGPNEGYRLTAAGRKFIAERHGSRSAEQGEDGKASPAIS